MVRQAKKKKHPTYTLKDIQAAFKDWSSLNISGNARDDIDDLFLTMHHVIDVIKSLKRSHFHTTRPGKYKPDIMQDSYKIFYNGCEHYLKFTLDMDGELQLNSFKENKDD
jgi:hypothetical protein